MVKHVRGVPVTVLVRIPGPQCMSKFRNVYSFYFIRSQQQNVQEEIMKKFREIVREASQAVYGNKLQGGERDFKFVIISFRNMSDVKFRVTVP